ncbi:MAG: hypothetical protein ACJ72O_09440 [Marmoricola sp.]
MPVVDLYLPDDLPIAADADLGRALAQVVDGATADAAAPCTVFVHRLPVYAVMSADVEGVRTVRVQVSCDAGPWLGLGPGLDEAVRSYLRTLSSATPTRVLVLVQAVTETSAMTWPFTARGLAV